MLSIFRVPICHLQVFCLFKFAVLKNKKSLPEIFGNATVISIFYMLMRRLVAGRSLHSLRIRTDPKKDEGRIRRLEFSATSLTSREGRGAGG